MALTVDINKQAPSSFQLVLPKIPTESSINAVSELVLNTWSAPLPGITIETEEQRWEGGTVQMASGRITFDQWSYNFMLDENLTNWKLIYNWMIYISNNKDKFYEYMENYVIDGTLRVLGNFQNEILIIHFIDMWPTTLSEVNLSYREAETVTEATVSFQYSRFEVV